MEHVSLGNHSARRLLQNVTWGLALLGLACASRPLGATDANLARAKSEASTGAMLFDANCAVCHGPRGEGRGGYPPLMGEGALPLQPAQISANNPGTPGHQQARGVTRPGWPGEDRPNFASALDLHDYLTTHMPRGKRLPLQDPEYWSVVQFLLLANGRDVPPEGLSAANAAQTAIRAP